MKILVLGRSGQVAQALQQADWPQDMSVQAAGRPEGDITRWPAMARVFEDICPDLVVNAAAYTAVDQAETDAHEARAGNVIGPAIIAQACDLHGIPLIHLSTDYIFDGCKQEPYREDDTPNPQNVYGLTKWHGEEAVAATLERHVTLRTSWVYSAGGSNFVRTMLRLGAERDRLSVVDDQTGAPTFAPDIAAAIVALCTRIRDGGDPWGPMHFCAAGHTTWYGFAQAVFESASGREGAPPLPALSPVATAAFPRPAFRPANSRLDCSRYDQMIGEPRRTWQEGLADCLDQLLGPVQPNGQSVIAKAG